jgi:uncharacterized protein YjbJ (UPF0337 family)
MPHRGIAPDDARRPPGVERRRVMGNEPQEKTGPESAVAGVVEDIKGKAKEVAGKLTNDENLRDEGRAQQEKAGAERDVAEHEARADAKRAEAAAREAEQRAHQKAN